MRYLAQFGTQLCECVRNERQTFLTHTSPTFPPTSAVAQQFPELYFDKQVSIFRKNLLYTASYFAGPVSYYAARIVYLTFCAFPYRQLVFILTISRLNQTIGQVTQYRAHLATFIGRNGSNNSYVSLFTLHSLPFNILKTKRILLYIRNQSVPRCKHFPPQL